MFLKEVAMIKSIRLLRNKEVSNVPQWPIFLTDPTNATINLILSSKRKFTYHIYIQFTKSWKQRNVNCVGVVLYSN